MSPEDEFTFLVVVKDTNMDGLRQFVDSASDPTNPACVRVPRLVVGCCKPQRASMDELDCCRVRTPARTAWFVAWFDRTVGDLVVLRYGLSLTASEVQEMTRPALGDVATVEDWLGGVRD